MYARFETELNQLYRDIEHYNIDNVAISHEEVQKEALCEHFYRMAVQWENEEGDFLSALIKLIEEKNNNEIQNN